MQYILFIYFGYEKSKGHVKAGLEGFSRRVSGRTLLIRLLNTEHSACGSSVISDQVAIHAACLCVNNVG